MRIFVITDSWDHYATWCREQHLRTRDAVFVNQPSRLRGKVILPDDQVVRVGPPPARLTHISQELQIARERGHAYRPITAAEQAEILNDLLNLWREVSR